MRLRNAIGFTAIGMVIGVAAVLFSAPAGAQASQVPSTEELNARFAIGPSEYAWWGSRINFRFMKDKQTGDCYLTRTTIDGDTFGTVVKTDDNACTGF